MIEAARDFESFVIEFMLQTMDNTIERSDLLGGGNGETIMRSMLYEEYAKNAAEAGGFGLAEMIVNQLTSTQFESPKNYDVTSNPISAPSVPLRENISFNSDENFHNPLDGVFSSGFGYRLDPFTGKLAFHHGLDIASPSGSEIRTSAPGTVTFSGAMGRYGNMVEIDHGDGCVTRYAHNSKNLVSKGDLVEKGQTIALVGMTGRTTGPHLHFEVQRNGEAINPEQFLKNGSEKAKEAKVFNQDADNRR
jgi:murein DD-endopeptidase MepM/ murein hydrolase activator NlpD